MVSDKILDMPFWRWKTWAVAFGLWTMIGAISFSRAHELIRIDHLICYFVWAVVTPPILALTRRFPLTGAHRYRHLILHTSFSLLVAPALVSVLTAILQLLIAPSGLRWITGIVEQFRQTFNAGLILEVLIYWGIVGAGQALDYYRRQQERELRAAQLEAQAAQLEASLRQAHLDALRMQLHPHFLFNTLNTISVLMQEDVEAANRLLLLLSELLRAAIKNEQQEVPLRQELDFLNRYLEIERTRFRDRLRAHIDVDPATLDALAPSLILQPLVENAIKHGVTKRAKAGLIEISARREGDFIELRVRDDGPGLAQTAGEAIGVGIANTRARLQKLYQTAFRFELQNVETGGLMVTIAFPFKSSYAHVEETIRLQGSDSR